MINAKTYDDFEEIILFDKPALFTPLRIDPTTIPDYVFKYEIRHDDDQQGIACELANCIIVNHWGSVITVEPIDLGDDNRVFMSDEDICYGIDSCLTLADFLEKYEEECALWNG